MSPTLHAVIALAAWPLVLTAAIVTHRSVLVLTGKIAANGFTPTGQEVSPFAARMCRAHANCYEHLPFAIALLVVALITGHVAVTDPLAFVFVGARLCQSAAHVSSTSKPAVLIRFGFFAVQVAIALYWAVRLVLHTT